MSGPAINVSPGLAEAATPILWGGVTAGILDIGYALIAGAAGGTPPARTLQSVASGLLGRASFEGGWNTAVLGLFLHFVIASGVAATYYAASRKFTVLVDRPVVAGLLYGSLVYFVMNRVVLPLSAVPFRTRLQISGLLVHIFLVGLPIALSVRLFSLKGRPI